MPGAKSTLPEHLRASVDEGLISLDEARMMATTPPDVVVRPRGRPSTGVLRTQVRLRPEDIERARALGGGNVSAGIRLALAGAEKPASSKKS